MSESSSSSDESDRHPSTTRFSSTERLSKKPKKKASDGLKFLTENLSTYKSTKIDKSYDLLVEPTEVRFDAIQPGVLYAMTIALRNTTDIAQRIRIQPPKSSYFALNYIPLGAVAPGLDVRIEIECQFPEKATNFDFGESIVATMGNCQVPIPIYASRASARISFDPFLDYGHVSEGQKVSRVIVFENSGEMPGVVDLKLQDDSRLKISPSHFDLPARSKEESRRRVKVEYETSLQGAWREVIGVKVSGGVSAHSAIDIAAQVVRPMLVLLAVNNGGAIDAADFGTLFYGQEANKTAYLYNGSPQPLSFTILYSDEEETRVAAGDGTNPQTDDSSALEKSIVISPTDGIVKPYSQFPIEMTFRPVVPVVKRGFTKQFNAENRDAVPIIRRASIDGIENGQRLGLVLQGAAVLPSVSVSPTTLQFGTCPVNDRRDFIIHLTNNAPVQTSFKFQKLPHFEMSPQKGHIMASQTKSIIASFKPSQLGKFKSTMKVMVAGGLGSTEIKLVAVADGSVLRRSIIEGADKVPEDFATIRKFVDPAEVLAERRGMGKTAATLAKSIDSEAQSVSSLDREYVYGSGVFNDPISAELSPTHPFVTKTENARRYNNYITQLRETRTNATMKADLERTRGADRSDPWGADMGMERGLSEPPMRIPVARDPLWLADRGSVGGKSRLPIDENRLVLKKYPSSPSSQAESRDCSTELSSADVKSVVASHKVINFGRVCINSISSKNFVVTNDLSHSVLIDLEDFEPELKASKPEAQVVPAGAFAGFDIVFSCRSLGKYKKTFSWSINKFHSYKITVLAEVIPIELVLDKKDLSLEFSDGSLDRSVSQEVHITNPGNATAEFMWGSAGAFECKPERGTVGPGHTVATTIKWTPSPGMRNEEELGLHISGGIDQTMVVTGVLYETKAQFEDKRLAIGTVAVGAERTYQTKMKNTGGAPFVFFVDEVEPDAAGISVSPTRGRILPGEDLALDVRINPRAAMSFDSLALTVAIRGSKNISLKLSGQSVVPQLELLERSFEFGSVTIGSEHVMPMTLENRTSISAELLLDLSAYPNFSPFATRSWTSDSDEDFVPLVQEDGIGNSIEFTGAAAKQGAATAKAGMQPVSTDTSATGGALKSKADGKKNVWRLILAPNSTLSGALIFRPIESAQYSFELPLFLRGIRDNRAFAVAVNAESVASRLLISSRLINFGDRVVARDPMSRSTYCQEISFKNLDSRSSLTYEIKDTAAAPEEGPKPTERGGQIVDDAQKKAQSSTIVPTSVFFVSPLNGTILPGASCAVFVTFLPQDGGDFYKRLTVFIDHQANPERPYLALSCKGSGVFPRLSFNKQQVDLPTVPLGIASSSTFIVKNEGYGALELKYRVSPSVPVPLSISFPDGPDVGLTMEKVRVRVSATADSPVSWAGKIEFYDTDGERFSIAITGCSDSCLLTNYTFVKTFSGDFGFIGLDNQPISFLHKAEILELRNQESRRREQARKQKALERQQQATASQEKGSTKTGRGNAAAESAAIVIAPAEKRLALPPAEVDYEKDGVDWRARSLIDGEMEFILKWLNRFVCRKPFETSRFPECITDSHGDVVVDCLEQISGQKIPGIKQGSLEVAESSYTSGSNKRATSNAQQAIASASKQSGNDFHSHSHPAHNANSQLNSKTATAVKLGGKYRTLLNWLLRSGALLNHVNPVDLLALDDHLLAQEVELKKLEGPRVTPAMVAERRQWWTAGWATNCKFSWMEVLLQSVKVFVLSRVTYSQYAKMPGVVVLRDVDAVDAQAGSGSGEGRAALKTKKKAKSNVPPEMAASNVFGQPEAVLLAWLSYHIQKSSNLRDEGAPDIPLENRALPLSNRVVDIEAELGDLRGFCQVMHSHIPDLAKSGGPLAGYTAAERTRDEFFPRLQAALDRARLNFDIGAVESTKSGRTLLLLLLHLFLNVPSLLPKAVIEFRGMLGAPISKMIELSNSSKKKVIYNVTIQGSSDFSLAYTEITLPPESTVEFPITLKASFSIPSSATVTFWGIRDSSGGFAGATMVFSLKSVVMGRVPIGTTNHAMNLFECETIPVQIANPFSKAGNFTVKLSIHHTPVSVDQAIKASNATAKKKRANSASYAPITDDTAIDSSPSGQPKAPEESEVEDIYKRPLWCQEDNFQIAVGGTHTFTLNVLPFIMGTYSCQIILVDNSVGEFCHLVEVGVGLPKTAEKLEFSEVVKNGVCVTKALRPASKNPPFEKAVGLATDLRIPNAMLKAKVRNLLTNLLASQITNEEHSASKFYINITSPYFSCQRDLVFVSEYPSPTATNFLAGSLASMHITPPTGMNSRGKKTPKSSIDPTVPADLVPGQVNPNVALLTFSPERPGTYNARAVLFSKENQLDVRVIDIVARVTMPESRVTIMFRGHARQRLSQEIPIQNDSDHDWHLNAIINGRGFSGQKSLVVPKRNKAVFTVGFVGAYAGSYEGALVLKKSDEDDSFEYTLRGITEEPLAEDSLHFRCKARDPQRFTLPLRHLERPPKASASEKLEKAADKKKVAVERFDGQRFSVQTDLPYMSGASEVEVPGNGCNYEFTINCPVGGMISGSVTFTDVESGMIQWFTVDVEVTSPQPESTIEVEAVVRKAVAVEITLDNPTDQELVFNVNIVGAGLLGDRTFTLPPRQTADDRASASSHRDAIYELIYSPLIPGQFSGKISFFSDRMGEIWYNLNLTAVPAPPTVLDRIECMIGSSATVQVPIENPLSTEVTVAASVSDPGHFSVVPEVVTLGPFSQSTFDLTFRPSSLSGVVSANVLFSHPQFGEIRYEVSGSALLPGILPTSQLFCPLGDVGSHTIVFRNPFAHPLPVDVVLTHAERASPSQTSVVRGRPVPAADTADRDREDSSAAFALLMRKSTDIVIAPKAAQQISLSFSPSRLGEYAANVEIRSSVGGRGLLWCYPLVGMAESVNPQKQAKLTTACKTSLRRDFDVRLEGLRRVDLGPNDAGPAVEDFSFELITDAKVKPALNRCLRIQPIEVVSGPTDSAGSHANTDFVVRYRALFEPLRVLQATVEMVVHCKNRGRWRAMLELEATEPSPDDTVRMTAAVGSSDKVSFRLSNRFLGYSPFQAYFAPRSSPHFSVYPSAGVLAPFGSEGTQFVVSFGPTDYRTRESATLIVMTEEAQWTYEILGSYPDHLTHSAKIKSKIDTRR